ncbi:helix-turn-helix domain-containing protein [Nocardia sp. CDC159]|uniref:Helix-turn-helix domain-containing protein n=1 Tax=Nocardia pulmonis TaxID=2951408 RepID=A0A9X2E4N3_9NOCA|nr:MULTISPECIES: helix-turn-helix domain-containing protein [Nocardia]MCM6773556.1 helix-turn-helix domain-containing protein [Nocardia pulmonis]MCM6786443.1 helix-turn-helix domain-containing protein [Nocardia sp. CDC159]
MNDHLYSVEEVADRLGLHVRTIRGYVRSGRLPAVRIGKQYRIAGADLEAFTGRPVPETPRASARRQRHSEVSSIVEIDAVDRATADRLSSVLMGAAGSRGRDERPLRVQTIYDEERARMKVVIVGGLGETARLLDYMEGVLAP